MSGGANNKLGRSVVVGCAIISAFVGSNAVADTSDSGDRSLRLTIELSVAARCGFATSEAAALIVNGFANMTAGQVRSVDFGVDCNVPFTVRARSTNGGMVPTGASAANLEAARADGFQLKLPYSVTLSVPLTPTMLGDAMVGETVCDSSEDMALSGPRSERCDLARRRGITFSGLSGAGPGQLALKMLPQNRQSIAGEYSDTITIDIEPAT